MESEALYSGDFVAGRCVCLLLPPPLCSIPNLVLTLLLDRHPCDRHTLRLRSPEVCVDARLLLVATDDRGQHQFDSLVVHFHGQSSLVLPWCVRFLGMQAAARPKPPLHPPHTPFFFLTGCTFCRLCAR